MTTQRRAVPMGPLLGAMVVGAAATGAFVWRVNLTALDRQIAAKTSALKKLVLSGKIPPNDEVMAYLISRQQLLEQQYQRSLERVAAAPVAEGARADLQLYFQEQFHDVQRTLERLATARSMGVPEQLGFPKELPPSDTVPRLLIQLSLIKEAAALLFEQGVVSLTSFKIEDPQTVPPPEAEEPFLIRLPVRVRLHATLPQLMKALGALQRVNPLIDVLAIRMAPQTAAAAAVPNGTGGAESPPTPLPFAGQAQDPLEAELMLSRYLVTAPTLEPPNDEDAPADRTSRGTKDRNASPKRAPKTE